jgi:hypothetical protein
MTKTIPNKNVVTLPSISGRGKRTFANWQAASDHQYGTRGYWLYKGLAISKREKATAEIAEDENRSQLFHRSQTHLLPEPLRSRRLLIAQFVRRPDWWGVEDHKTHEITQWPGWSLYGSLRDAVYRSFHHTNAHKGVRLSLRQPRMTIWGDDLFVRAGEKTNWFVLDLDNHEPTLESTQAHLRLLQRLVKVMPRLVQRFGVKSVFYDYRQDAPQGIHIWVMIKSEPKVSDLHARVRGFLQEHSDPDLDRELDRRGLRRMGSLEILPTEKNLIRLFGTYGRPVFTTTELKPKDGWFDAPSLYKHIMGKVTDGDPCQRYAALAQAGLNAGRPLPSPSFVPMAERVCGLLESRPARTGHYFADLVDAALNGVSEGDVLFQAYLSPLAQCLYFRDFHGLPDRNARVIRTLMSWLERKHNGTVTRINQRNRRNLVAVVKHIVKHMHETPDPIQSYWEKVRKNDDKYPGQRISVKACMDATLASPVRVARETLNQVIALLKTGEGGGVAGEDERGVGNTYNRKDKTVVSPPLPPLVEARLRDHLTRIPDILPTTQDRVIHFAEGLLREIGLKGERRIRSQRINELAGLGKGRRHADRYKKYLLGAGILLPWKNSGVPKVKATLYRLADWVIKELEP